MKESMKWVNAHFTAADEEGVLRDTQTLIRSRSYNPPGDETAAAAFAAEKLKNAGFAVELEEFMPKRCNVIATYGDPEHIGLILNGHLDVVPAFGEWKIPPDQGVRKDGILHGRGSCDMLGGVAAILRAAELIGRSGVEAKQGVAVILVSDEEDMNRGIRHILATRKLKAGGAIIAEPTSCEIHLGNRGFSSYYIETTGVGCHASKPWEGVNAIYKMGDVIKKVEAYAESLAEVTNPYLGQATACIGTIKGGVRLNTVPDHCVIEVERRLLPGETQEQIHGELQAAVGAEGQVKDRSFFPASLIDSDHELVKKCREGLEELLSDKPVTSVFTACTEASMFSVQCGIPALLLGPGSIKQAHRVDEFCPENEIVICAKLFAGLFYEAAKGRMAADTAALRQADEPPAHSLGNS